LESQTRRRDSLSRKSKGDRLFHSLSPTSIHVVGKVNLVKLFQLIDPLFLKVPTPQVTDTAEISKKRNSRLLKNCSKGKTPLKQP
jgi:hypothetical protein